MKIVIANTWAYPYHEYGGIQKRIYHLARNIIREGHSVEIVTSLSPEISGNQAVFEDIAFTFLPPRISWKNPYSYTACVGVMLYAWNLASYLKRQEFDVLHSHITTPYFYLRYRERAPVVFQPFEEIYEFKALSEERNDIFWTVKRNSIYTVKRHIDNYCMSHTDAIASEGDFQDSIFIEQFGVSKSKLFELPVGIDITTADNLLENAKVSRKETGIGEDDFVAISVNQIKVYKGIDYLIEAFELIKQDMDNAKLILVGSGPNEEAVKAEISRLGLEKDILHFSSVPEEQLYGYYKLSDVYISPTFDTGSVQSVIEAMACGLPVVTTGQKFWVEDGKNGYVVPVKDAPAIARAVVNLYQSGKSGEFGKMSRARAQNYDYPNIARQAIAKYEELVSK